MQSVHERREQNERQRLKKKMSQQQADTRMLRPQEALHVTQMQALEQEQELLSQQSQEQGIVR
jgi:hypothetical protein